MATDTPPAAAASPNDPPRPDAGDERHQGVLATMLGAAASPIEPARAPADTTPEGQAAADDVPVTGASSDIPYNDAETPAQNGTKNSPNGVDTNRSVPKAFLLAAIDRWAQGGNLAAKRLDIAKVQAQRAPKMDTKEDRKTNRTDNTTTQNSHGAGAGGKNLPGKDKASADKDRTNNDKTQNTSAKDQKAPVSGKDGTPQGPAGQGAAGAGGSGRGPAPKDSAKPVAKDTPKPAPKDSPAKNNGGKPAPTSGAGGSTNAGKGGGQGPAGSADKGGAGSGAKPGGGNQGGTGKAPAPGGSGKTPSGKSDNGAKQTPKSGTGSGAGKTPSNGKDTTPPPAPLWKDSKGGASQPAGGNALKDRLAKQDTPKKAPGGAGASAGAGKNTGSGNTGASGAGTGGKGKDTTPAPTPKPAKDQPSTPGGKNSSPGASSGGTSKGSTGDGGGKSLTPGSGGGKAPAQGPSPRPWKDPARGGGKTNASSDQTKPEKQKGPSPSTPDTRGPSSSGDAAAKKPTSGGSGSGTGKHTPAPSGNTGKNLPAGGQSPAPKNDSDAARKNPGPDQPFKPSSDKTQTDKRARRENTPTGPVNGPKNDPFTKTPGTGGQQDRPWRDRRQDTSSKPGTEQKPTHGPAEKQEPIDLAKKPRTDRDRATDTPRTPAGTDKAGHDSKPKTGETAGKDTPRPHKTSTDTPSSLTGKPGTEKKLFDPAKPSLASGRDASQSLKKQEEKPGGAPGTGIKQDAKAPAGPQPAPKTGPQGKQQGDAAPMKNLVRFLEDYAKNGPPAKSDTAGKPASAPERRQPIRTQPSREAGYRIGSRAALGTGQFKAVVDGARDGWADGKAATDHEKNRMDQARADRKIAPQKEKPVSTPPTTPRYTRPDPKPIEVKNVGYDDIKLGAGARDGKETVDRGEIANLKQYERRLHGKSDAMDKSAEVATSLEAHATTQAEKATRLLEAAKTVKGGDNLIGNLTTLQEAAQLQAGKAQELRRRSVRSGEASRVLLHNVDVRYGGIYNAIVQSPDTSETELLFYKEDLYA